MKSSVLQRSLVLICLFSIVLFSSYSSQAQHCTTSPIIQMPSTYLGCPGDDITPANTGVATATPGDENCPLDIMVTYSDDIFTNTACEVLIKRSWMAEYMEPTQIPLSSTREQIIWLIDADGPYITYCPGSITLVDTDPVYIWTEPKVIDYCGVETVYSNFQSEHSFPVGTTVVTYTAVDNCGNTSTCSFSVTVQQCSATLTLDCPKKYNGCPSDDISVDALGEPTINISSYDCGTPVLSYRDTIIKDKVCNKKIERIWTAEISDTDIYAECRQVIKLKDNSPPTIDGCPEDVTLDISEATYYWKEPTAWDDCEIVFFGSDVSNGSTFPLGTTTVTYLAEDGCGESATCSFTVTVEEKICGTDLEIICPPKYVGCRHESPLPYNTGEPTIEYSHNNCDDIIVTYEDYIIANNKCKLKFDRIWTAKVPGTDLYVQCTQRVNLKDDLPPVIDRCPEDVTLDVSEATYHWDEPIALDNCKIASFESDVNSGTTFPVGTTTVTYVAKDVCGETATCSFTVTVERKDCVTGLELICPPKYVACRHESPWPENTGEPSIEYSYNNCDEIIVTYKDEIIVNNSCKLKFDRIWTAKVPGTHIYAQCTQRINLKDNEAPVITYCPSDVTIYSEMSKYIWDEPTTSDNCSYVTLSSSVPNGYDFPIGMTEVVITATDECGNESTCSFKVRVKEHPGSGLLISCPDDIVIECRDNLHYDKWPLPEVNTSCTKCDHDYIDNFVYMGQYNGHRYFCSKYAATWEDAHEKAQYLGGHLAIINSEEENHYLSNLITVRSAYIGLTDKEYEGTFEWVNGEPVTYSNWYPGQPNNYRGLQNYVELLYNGYWNDQYNYKKLEFIVEFPCVKIEQTKGPHYPNQFTGYSTTIEYKVTDACGNVATCSFEVVKHGKLQLTCPEDIVVDLQYGQYEVYVNWEEPTVETCCAGVTDLKHYIPGFVYMGSRGGHDYYCSEYHATWHDAQKDCENHGGYLAVIDDYEENNMLANFLTVQSAYIGLSDHHDEGYFQWINNAPLYYTNSP